LRLANVKEPTDLFVAQMIRFALHGRSTALTLEAIAQGARYHLEKRDA
jgi:hypothetical protein